MNKSFLPIIAAVLIAFLSSCGQSAEKNTSTIDSVAIKDQALLDNAKQFFQPLPDNAFNEEYPLIPAQVKLGKMLFFDTRLSLKGNNSCNSCHNLNTFGVDNEVTSIGDNGGRGVRNSPTVFNAAIHFTQFWDGRAKDVEEQAGMPILNPVEMAMPHEKFMIKRLAEIPEYKELFATAFADDKNSINYKNMAKAIGAFERTLMTPSKFDDFLKGDLTAMNTEEKDGLKVFMQVGCTNCHIGPAIGGNMFQKFGLFKDYRPYTSPKNDDTGRMSATNNEVDKDMFKVPSLRNIEKTYPYFHDGSIADLNQAIKIMGEVQLNKTLSDDQVIAISTFLKTLTADISDEAKVNPLTVKL